MCSVKCDTIILALTHFPEYLFGGIFVTQGMHPSHGVGLHAGEELSHQTNILIGH